MSLRIKTFDEIVSATLARIGSRSAAAGKPVSNFNVGAIVRTLIEAVSESVAELYAYAAEMLLQSFMDTASGLFLTRKAREFGKERKAAVKTSGSVIYSRKAARSTNITIPANSIVATKKDRLGRSYRFFTTEERILESGQTSVAVPIVAENAGKAYNVEAGTILEMRTYIGGIDAVTNGSDWIDIAGADEELDTALRRRVFLAWEELAANGPLGFYQSLALAVSGVASAWVDDKLPRGEGTIDVYIMGESGPPLSGSALITAAQSAIDARRAPGSDVKVYPPSIVKIGPYLSVTPLASQDTGAIEDEIHRRLRILFTLEADTDGIGIPILGVGRDVVVAQLIYVVMGVPGVYSVAVNALSIEREGAAAETIRPAADVLIDSDEFPSLGAIAITFNPASYERQT